jgi:uncharacterized protein (TIGR03435 family)
VRSVYNSSQLAENFERTGHAVRPMGMKKPQMTEEAVTFPAMKIAFLIALVILSSRPSPGQQAAANSAQSSFEVASIKPSRPDSRGLDWDDSPGRVSISGYTLHRLIRAAYGLKSNAQVLGGPKWIDSERFDIVAKADDAETTKMQKMSDADSVTERNRMLQSLLAERFHLKVMRSTRVLPAYALVVVKSGIKFKPAKSGEDGDLSGWGGHLEATAITMDAFADYLTGFREIADRIVQNRTSLTATYDFNFDWSRDRGDGGSQDSEFPGLYTALEEQLGLKLEPMKASTEVVIVESASEPALE